MATLSTNQYRSSIIAGQWAAYYIYVDIGTQESVALSCIDCPPGTIPEYYTNQTITASGNYWFGIQSGTETPYIDCLITLRLLDPQRTVLATLPLALTIGPIYSPQTLVGDTTISVIRGNIAEIETETKYFDIGFSNISLTAPELGDVPFITSYLTALTSLPYSSLPSNYSPYLRSILDLVGVIDSQKLAASIDISLGANPLEQSILSTIKNQG